MWRPAGRARRWFRSIIARWRSMIERPHPVAVLNVGGVANVTFIGGSGDPACLRYRSRQCADRRFHARAHRPCARSGRRECRARAGGRRGGEARSRASVLCAEAAEIARPQRLPRMGGGGSGPCGQKCAGRRRDTDRDHGGIDRGHRSAAAEAAAQLDRRRRRRAESARCCECWQQRLAPASVETANAVGWNSDAVEAQAFAYMAVRHLRGSADHVSDHDRRRRSRCRAACWRSRNYFATGRAPRARCL